VAIKRSSLHRVSLSALLLLFVLPWPADAQRYGRGRGRFDDAYELRGHPEVPVGFTFCRLQFDEVRGDPSGTGWAIEYPRAEQNFMTRLSELTVTGISRWNDGRPGHVVVRATSPELFQCPFLMMSSPGTAGFTDQEVRALREYLLKGGFLWGDDFWGDASWAHWEQQLARILPGLTVRDIEPGHPLYDTFYLVRELPQIPSLNRYRPGLGTSERPGAEYATPHMRGVFDEDGQLLVLMTHNTDIADGWEREADMEVYAVAFAWKAYSLGVNVAIWMMTH